MHNQASADAKRITWTTESIGYRSLANGKRSYCYRFRDADGKQRCFFLGAGSTERQAKDKLATVRVQKHKGEDVRVSHELLAVFAERWLNEQAHLTPGTAADYRGHLNRYISRCPHLRKSISKVTQTDVVAFIAWMSRYREPSTRRPTGTQLKGWTIRGSVKVLSAILTEAVEQGILASNPVGRVSEKKRPKTNDATPKRILTIDELDALLAASKTRGVRWQTLVALFAYAGLRKGEALGLRWSDVDFERSVIRVRRQLDQHGNLREPKSAAGKREVPISTTLRRALAEWKIASRFTGPTDPVITTATGTPVSHRNAHRAITTIALSCGINVSSLEETNEKPNLDLHALRHLAGSAFIKATNGDVERVARWMGHADTKVLLDVYAHEFEEVRGGRKIEEDIARLDAVFGR